MKHLEGNFKGVRDTNIYYQAWLTDGEPKAVLLVVHGLGEHSGRYMNVVNHFVPLGYAVYALDHIGHGKSEGAREGIERFDDYTDTLTTFYNLVKGWQIGKPMFLLGHSMGGLIATYYLIDHQANFKGAVISGPLLAISKDISPITIAMGKILSAVAPQAGVVALDATGISSDPNVVQAYVNDPLVFHAKTPARLAAEMLRAVQQVTGQVDKICLPFIVIQGSADKLVDPAGARILYDRSSSKDKTIKVYDGFYHEVFNEPDRARVLKDVEDWLALHV